jgi:hypothetical protein
VSGVGEPRVALRMAAINLSVPFRDIQFPTKRNQKHTRVWTALFIKYDAINQAF